MSTQFSIDVVYVLYLHIVIATLTLSCFLRKNENSRILFFQILTSDHMQVRFR